MTSHWSEYWKQGQQYAANPGACSDTARFERIQCEQFCVAQHAGKLFKQRPPGDRIDEVASYKQTDDSSERIGFLRLNDIPILARLCLALLGGFKFLFAAVLILLCHGSL